MLLEGDEPPPPPVSGPGHRYALFPTLTARGAGESAEVAELPESYGTERLFLTARDPHWLYAHWDLTREQQREYNRRSVDRHLVLRVFRNGVEGEPFREIHLQPESRSWFAHVGLGGTKYVAQLGYYAAPDQWVAIATSGATLTPPDSLSEDVSVWFETMPSEVQHEHLLEIVKSAVSEHLPLMEALAQLRASGFEGLPASLERVTPSTWTPAQEKALASVITMDAVRR
ncbi:MAG TPA: DUF4912 domain-containing protein, partial [Methylomirabilota bacterium]|nr:DUF4912 domain-containing protein [Methylomirabilota bacterium]